MNRTARPLITALAALALTASGCGAFSGAGDDEDATKTITVVTHDSFAMKKSVIAAFEKKSGYDVKLVPNGDAGALTNKLVLTKDDPIGDAVYGIDNTFASRAVDAGILSDHTPAQLPDGAASYALSGEGGEQLTPIDYGDVCVNVDDAWFAKRGKTPPRTLDDLTKPAYRDDFVVPGPTSSSPGLAFLLTTIAAEGEDGWQGYWKKLLANGVKIDAGWSDAYEVDFTGGGGDGDRPVVLSYASSPPYTIPKGGTKPTTSALLDTCYRQVEYAGVLKGAENAKGAAAFVDFMQTKQFQQEMPEQMYVYPVAKNVALPADWAKSAAVATKPYVVAPSTVAAKRTTWLRQWRDLTSR